MLLLNCFVWYIILYSVFFVLFLVIISGVKLIIFVCLSVVEYVCYINLNWFILFFVVYRKFIIFIKF